MKLLLLILLLIPNICLATSYSIQNGNLITVDGNGNLGVGNSSPGTKVDVTGTARATAFSGPLTGNATTATALAANGTNCSAGNYPLGVDASGNSEGCTAAAAGGSSQWSTQLGVGIGTYNAVGIGTMTPNSQLFVKGRTMLSNIGANSLVFDLNGANFGVVYDKTVDSTLYFGGASPITAIPGMSLLALDFDTNNVGIGTDFPLKTLDVRGTGRFSSTLSASNFSGTSSGTNTGDQTTVSGNAGTATALAANGTNCSAGSYALGVDASGNAEGCTVDNAATQWATQNTTDVSLAGGNVGIGTTTTQKAALAVMNGNVGIGTWVPFSQLAIKTSSSNPMLFMAWPGGPGYNFISLNGSGTTAQQVGLIGGSNDNNLYIVANGASANGQIHFRPNGNTTLDMMDTGGRMNIGKATSTANILSVFGDTDMSGNLGIGTVTPSIAKLSIIGNVGIGTVKNGDNYLTTTPPSGGMIVEGNVGIGTFIPSAGLELGGGKMLRSTGTAPTVANNDCGTTAQGTVTAGSTDMSGDVTVGTLTVTSCRITFNGSYTPNLRCVLNDDTSILTVRPGTITATTLTINSTTSMSGDVVTWKCSQ